MDLLCSARKFRAPEALALGLVSRVIPDDKLLAETRAYATLLANTVSPRSVAVMKRQLWEAEFQTLAEATAQANHEMELSFQTADFKEGVAHFSRSARRGSREATVAQTFSVSLARGCQVIRRRSTAPTAVSSTSAKAVSTRMPANTVLMSKVPSACRIR